jgi:hypothetical protein
MAVCRSRFVGVAPWVFYRHRPRQLKKSTVPRRQLGHANRSDIALDRKQSSERCKGIENVRSLQEMRKSLLASFPSIGEVASNFVGQTELTNSHFASGVGVG